jgi:predicted TPR repeat methyltransferase
MLFSSGDLRADRRYEMAKSYLKDGEREIALDLITQTLELTPDWLPALALACEISPSNLLLSHMIALDPDDIYGGGILLSKFKGETGVLSNAYISSLFDDYAPRFEKALVQDLSYQAPELLLAVLKSDTKFHYETVVDAGCGTGLMGALIDSVTERLLGSDLAQDMLRFAKTKGIYAELYHGDMIEHLTLQKEVDLVIAADVLVYVGDLQPFIDTAFTALKPEGYLAFTVQAGENSVILGDDWRYAHSETYLRETLKAFHVKRFLDITPRYNQGKPVKGYLILAEKQ